MTTIVIQGNSPKFDSRDQASDVIVEIDNTTVIFNGYDKAMGTSSRLCAVIVTRDYRK